MVEQEDLNLGRSSQPASNILNMPSAFTIIAKKLVAPRPRKRQQAIATRALFLAWRSSLEAPNSPSKTSQQLLRRSTHKRCWRKLKSTTLLPPQKGWLKAR